MCTCMGMFTWVPGTIEVRGIQFLRARTTDSLWVTWCGSQESSLGSLQEQLCSELLNRLSSPWSYFLSKSLERPILIEKEIQDF